MKHYCWLLIIFICFHLHSQAQERSFFYNGKAQKRSLYYRTAINVSPLALVNTDNQLRAGFEYRFSRDWGFAADAGFVFGSYYIDEGTKARGFELRPAMRYYHGKYKREYLQVQLFYKMVDYQFHDWLGKDAVNRVPTYERLQDFTYRKKVLSLCFMAGETIPLSDNLFLDVYGGIGARYKDQGVTEPNSVYMPAEENGRTIYGPHVWNVCVPAGVKLAVILK
jgi:hypothetical protein